MRYFLLSLLAIFLHSGLAGQSIKPIEDPKLPYNYLLHLPKNYDANKSYPLLVYLHGRSIRGTDLDKVKRYGVIYEVLRGLDIDFIVIAPQCQVRWENDRLIELLDLAQKQYPVDLRKVYLTGMSMGGYGAWYLAGEHPDRFAAVAPVAGGGRVSDAENMKNLPHWVFHGAKDKPVPVTESKKMVAALRNAGNQQVKFDLYPNKDHGDLVHVYEKESLYEWFLEHERAVPADSLVASNTPKPPKEPEAQPQRPRPQRPKPPKPEKPSSTKPEPEKPSTSKPQPPKKNPPRPKQQPKWWQFWLQPFWSRWLG